MFEDWKVGCGTCVVGRVCVTDDWLLEDVAFVAVVPRFVASQFDRSPLHSPIGSHLLFSSGETCLLR